MHDSISHFLCNCFVYRLAKKFCCLGVNMYNSWIFTALAKQDLINETVDNLVVKEWKPIRVGCV